MTSTAWVLTDAAPGSALNWRNWRISARQINGAACVAGYVALLWAAGTRSLAILLVVEAGLLLLPWQLPRRQRGAGGFWAETLVGLLAPTGALVVALLTRASWLSHSGSWWWYAIALAVAAGLLALGGLRPGAVWTGETAFLKGSTPRSHGLARAFAAAVAPFGEEALFRAPALTLAAGTPTGLLAAVAFAGRHYLPAGTNRRGDPRGTLTEVAAAGALLALTVASGSVYPALLCHLVNNASTVVVELQRIGVGAEEEWQ